MLIKHLPDQPNCNSILTEESFTDLEDFDGLTYPVAVTDIDRFKRRNPGVSVNVFEVGDDSKITPLRVVVEEKKDHTDFLLYRDSSRAGHYVYIIDFARLIRSQITCGTNRTTVCKRCGMQRQCSKSISVFA